MNGVSESGGWRSALIVFSGRADLWWLRLLKPGFRHCFVVLEGEEIWLVIDPLSHRTALAQIPKCQEFNLANWYACHGLHVVFTTIKAPSQKALPFRPYSCVEEVKRILGIRAPWVLTPWQLFRHVNKTGKFMLTTSGN